jgi:hypothetical protein
MHDLADILMGAVADELMHVIRRYLARYDLLVILHCNLPQQTADANCHRPRQHPLPVFWNPYEMNLAGSIDAV